MDRRAVLSCMWGTGSLVATMAMAMFRFDDGQGGYSARTSSFVNWETPHVHPVDTTPDGARLLVCNTPAASLMVFDIASGIPVLIGEAPVGLDPVSVRARDNNYAWVVNHVSDSVSIVDLTTFHVVRTIKTADEPCDVVFAGSPPRAFVTCSQVNIVQVFDPANLGGTPVSITIEGEDPRALAVSPDGQTVYAAVFESGNRTTILGGGGASGSTIAFPPNVVSDSTGPYGGVNPPPNSGNSFNPPLAQGLPTPPRVGLIVRKNASGLWMDDNAHDWTNLVSGAQASRSGRLPGWDLVDQDLAVINADTLSVSYATGLMNLCMAVGVNPVTGVVGVVGTDATNEIRFEPNLRGRFLRVNLALVNPTTLAKTIVDLNPHLTYASSSVPMSEREKSVGDPRAIVWNAAGTRGYVAGMGSNNVIVVNSAGARAGLSQTIEVGEGPTGLALDEARSRLYVLNRFEASVSVIDTVTEAEIAKVSFFDPTPSAIKVGRKHLYDTHRNSGLGHIACASCHVDSRMDRLAWDLGDPTGSVEPLTDRNLGFGLPGLTPGSPGIPSYSSFHPMKGPMATQTLQDIIGHEPHHWRGDRLGLENFAGAFMGLQGDDTALPSAEMQEFEDFLATIHFPPNPNRNFDNSLPTVMTLNGHYKTGRFGGAGQPLPPGNAQAGMALYRSTTRRLDGGALACVTCHTLPTGTGTDFTYNSSSNTYQPIPPGPLGQRHHALVSVDGSTQTSIKIPQLRNMHEKAGFNTTQLRNTAGFGYLHDGSVDSIERFISEPAFNVANDQEVADLVAFMLCFSGSDLPMGSTVGPFEPPGTPGKDTHAAVGRQTTLRDAANPDPGQAALIASMMALAEQNKVGLIAKGRMAGRVRGWAYVGGDVFQSDHAGETITASALQAQAGPGTEVTFTVVPEGSETRLGIDRDLDGVLDFDEGPVCDPDVNCDGSADGFDIEAMEQAVGGDSSNFCQSDADFNRDGSVDGFDVEAVEQVVGGGSCP